MLKILNKIFRFFFPKNFMQELNRGRTIGAQKAGKINTRITKSADRIKKHSAKKTKVRKLSKTKKR